MSNNSTGTHSISSNVSGTPNNKHTKQNKHVKAKGLSTEPHDISPSTPTTTTASRGSTAPNTPISTPYTPRRSNTVPTSKSKTVDTTNTTIFKLSAGGGGFSSPWNLSRKSSYPTSSSSNNHNHHHGGAHGVGGHGLLKRRRGNQVTYQDTPIDASWKIEKFPQEQDWWDPSTPPPNSSSFTTNKATAALKSITPPAIANCWKQTGITGGNTSSNTITPTSSPTRGINNKNNPSDENNTNSTNQDNDHHKSTTTNIQPTKPTKIYTKENATFINIGHQNWEKARQEWRKKTVSPETIAKQSPPPVRTDLVIRGLSQLQRTYELPGRMSLSNVIGVLDRIWNCDRDL